MRTTIADVLYDQVSAPNAELDTGSLDVGAYDGLLIELTTDAVRTACSLEYHDPDNMGSTGGGLLSPSVPADILGHTAAWGPGCGAAASGRYLGGLPAVLPSHVKFFLTAGGVGVSQRMRVIGRRNRRGPETADTTAEIDP